MIKANALRAFSNQAELDEIRCLLCTKTAREVQKLVRSGRTGATICNECVDSAAQMISPSSGSQSAPPHVVCTMHGHDEVHCGGCCIEQQNAQAVRERAEPPISPGSAIRPAPPTNLAELAWHWINAAPGWTGPDDVDLFEDILDDDVASLTALLDDVAVEAESRGAAAALGLMGMAEAIRATYKPGWSEIRERQIAQLEHWHAGRGKHPDSIDWTRWPLQRSLVDRDDAERHDG